jgi:uncharacterized protein YqeY
MSNLKEQISTELKEAMREKNKEKLNVLRSIKTAIANKETAKGNTNELDDTAVLSVIESLVKQRKQSIDMFTTGGRLDLVEEENTQLEILEKFLPKKLSESETQELVQSLIDTGASNIGDVMKSIKKDYGNTVDSKLASQIARNLL